MSLSLSPDSASRLSTAGMLYRVAVTGATGFVGSHLVQALAAKNVSINAVVRPTSRVDRLDGLADVRIASLDDVDSLTRAFEGCEIVFHLAGAVDFHGDWDRFHQVNVVGTKNVLKAAARAGVRKAVVASSIVAVAAGFEPQAVDESADWNLGNLRIPYVATKRQAEETALAQRYGNLEVVVANPSCVIGPGDEGSEFGTLLHRFWKGRTPVFFGGGSNFVDVRDVAHGLIAAAERGRPGERYLLAGTNVTWDDFFVELSRSAGRSIPRLRLPNFVGELFAKIERRYRAGTSKRPNLSPEQAALMPRYFFFRSDKAKRELGFEPRPLRTTLRETYESWSQSTAKPRASRAA